MTAGEYRRLEAMREQLRRQFAAEMGRGVAMTPKARRIAKQIDEIEAAIEAADRDARRRLRMQQFALEDMMEVMAIPLIADVMNDLVTGLDTMLRKAGLPDTVYGEATRELRRKSLWIVDRLATADFELPEAGISFPAMVENDETLVEAVKKKVMSYIRHRIQPHKKKQGNP